ncbi:hypothetical protein H4219_003984 [Mycoemilia scoparia]|uniref:HTH APSES-type domain-containing protein n=1 Tax=Mycoemilia scoparia TaxID=417184 RepID=A0A9W8A2L3_9FUNG|nr:hypothetical protein H4219_003984 [Mycoemilia scoparia]
MSSVHSSYPTVAHSAPHMDNFEAHDYSHRPSYQQQAQPQTQTATGLGESSADPQVSGVHPMSYPMDAYSMHANAGGAIHQAWNTPTTPMTPHTGSTPINQAGSMSPWATQTPYSYNSPMAYPGHQVMYDPQYATATTASTNIHYMHTNRARLTTTLWEDEQTIVYQVDARGVCVARRNDDNMINGTKLLNVVGMSRGKRDGILKNEKGRRVVKVGPMHLKGVWIPFERAKILADQFKITEALFPLFQKDPTAYLYGTIPAQSPTHAAIPGVDPYQYPGLGRPATDAYSHEHPGLNGAHPTTGLGINYPASSRSDQQQQQHHPVAGSPTYIRDNRSTAHRYAPYGSFSSTTRSQHPHTPTPLSPESIDPSQSATNPNAGQTFFDGVLKHNPGDTSGISQSLSRPSLATPNEQAGTDFTNGNAYSYVTTTPTTATYNNRPASLSTSGISTDGKSGAQDVGVYQPTVSDRRHSMNTVLNQTAGSEAGYLMGQNVGAQSNPLPRIHENNGNSYMWNSNSQQQISVTTPANYSTQPGSTTYTALSLLEADRLPSLQSISRGYNVSPITVKNEAGAHDMSIGNTLSKAANGGGGDSSSNINDNKTMVNGDGVGNQAQQIAGVKDERA